MEEILIIFLVLRGFICFSGVSYQTNHAIGSTVSNNALTIPYNLKQSQTQKYLDFGRFTERQQRDEQGACVHTCFGQT